MIETFSNYQESYYKYDRNGYYDGRQDKGYYRINSTSGISASREKADAVTNSFRLKFFDSNQTDEISCDDILTLDNITFSANIWSKRTIREGFRQYTKKSYSSKNDNFSSFYRLKINFTGKIFSRLSSSKRKALESRLDSEFSDWIDMSQDDCFMPSFEVSSKGNIRMILDICAG